MRDAKLMPNENGIGAALGVYEGVTSNHDGIKIHKFTEKFVDGGKDAKLILAKNFTVQLP